MDRLLVELRKTGMTFAIVVDEYGGTAGLATLEDVVEHIVGDIAGSFETAGEPEVEHLGPHRWRVGAGLSVPHEWADFFGHDPTIEGVATLEAVRHRRRTGHGAPRPRAAVRRSRWCRAMCRSPWNESKTGACSRC